MDCIGVEQTLINPFALTPIRPTAAHADWYTIVVSLCTCVSHIGHF